MGNESAGNLSFGPIDELCVNTIRFLAVDGVEAANSGHPGMPMGDAPMAYALWTRFLRHTSADTQWPSRDRFVLSAGHGSMLLYSLLHLFGYKITLDDLKKFRQWESPTPGHPEYSVEHGIETTTGPLGQGFATGVGMAMAAKYMAGRYNKPGYNIIDYNVYAITSDGDHMEGVSNEAASIAGHLGLGSIVYLYSDNRITIEGSTDVAFTEDVGKRFEALKWHVQKVGGNDLAAISRAIEAAKAETARPSLILVRTHIGYGSPAKQDTAEAHGSPLGKEEIKITKTKLGWPLTPDFFIPDDAKAHFEEAVKFGSAAYADWKKLFSSYGKDYPELAAELTALNEGRRPTDWIADLPKFSAKDGAIATRSASGKVLNAIAAKTPFLIGGSADLSPSTNTILKGMGDFTAAAAGRNLHFGVREHAMGSILNGMALSRALVPYGATFLVFSDYARPAIRLAALMSLQLVYVFTHDSIGLGEDGPTHQPIEHLAALRAIPNVTVIRPADANEVVAAWKYALKDARGPVILALSRQNLPIIDRDKFASADGVLKGAYVLADCAGGTPQVIIIATGSEVELAMKSYDELTARSLRARVVSMPSCELFEAQDEAYKASVIPPSVKARIVVEAGSPMGWHRYAGDGGVVLGIQRFGASAPYKTVYEKFGLTPENITSKAVALIAKNA